MIASVSSVQVDHGPLERRLLAAYSADAGWAASVTLIAQLALPCEKAA